MSEVAYGVRDLPTIQKRAKVYFIYRVIKKLLSILLRVQNKQVKTILTYPAISQQEYLFEIANKIVWAFPQRPELNVSIMVTKELQDSLLVDANTGPYMRNYLQGDLSYIHLVTREKKSDLKLFVDAGALWWSNIFKFHRTDILDKNFFSDVEGHMLQFGYEKTLSVREKESSEKLSRKNFELFMERYRHKKKAYCFVTGPSFDLYDQFTYEKESLKVICNSTVKNDAFLSYIGAPDLLVFADPVFHFSPSEYSAAFRDEVVKVYKKYKPYIAVPFRSMALLLKHYPFLEDRLIGIKIQRGEFHFPSSKALWLRGSKNILTQFMLPIASSVSDEIYIIGADGRKPEEKYFWKHSKSAQFDDLMQTVFETHPSFFRDRDYKDYYEEHCAFLEKLIRYGEERGKRYFSLTPSYIPALKERMN